MSGVVVGGPTPPDPQLTLRVDARPSAQRLAVEMVSVDPLTADQTAYLVDQWGSIATAIEWGILTDGGVSVRQAGARVLSHSLTGSGTLRLELDVAGIGLSGWRVVLQLMVALSAVSVPLASVSITSQTATSAQNVGTVFATAYRPAVPPVFPVTREPREADRDRNIEVQFAGSLDSGAQSVVARAFAAWMDLVNGGFAADGSHPSENACDATSVEWLDDATAFCAVPNYLGAEAAFDAVVNMAAAFHAKLTAVVALEIA